MVTSIKQVTNIKQACIHFTKMANALKCTCIKQAPVLNYPFGAYLIQIGLDLYIWSYDIGGLLNRIEEQAALDVI